MEIRPAGNRILIKRDKVEDHDPTYKKAKAAGIELPETEEHLRRQAGMDRGVVVDMGPSAYSDTFYQGRPWCKVGDMVIFPQYAGKAIRNHQTDEAFIVINDEDVIAVIEE